MPEQSLLSVDHDQVDEIFVQAFAALERGDHHQALERLAYFWARLAMHIRAEHLHLFPAMVKKALLQREADAPSVKSVIAQLREDHNFFMSELSGAVKTMREAASNRKDACRLTEVKKRLENVRRRLMTHNKTEASNIYPLSELLFTQDEADEICQKMKRELDNLPPRFADNA